jgi:hypothetical protein
LESYWIPEVAANRYVLIDSGPLVLAVLVSVAYVIRSTVDTMIGEAPGLIPPPNQPYVLSDDAVKPCLIVLNGPLVLAVAVL